MHSSEGEVLQLKNLIKEQTKEEKEQIIRSIKRNLPETREKLKEVDLEFGKIFQKIKPRFPQQRRVLIIPESKLPPHLQYLRPTPRNVEIDLKKLNLLIKDPAVKVIKCDGPDEHIIVMGSMGVKPTNVVLSKEDIKNTIQKFSETSKIPIHEGVYHVVVGRLIFSAVISEVVSSKFMIKKMLYTRNFMGQTYPNPIIR